jgi:hypothetical protein
LKGEKISPTGAAQNACAALAGLNLHPILVPGFQSPLSRALPPWAFLPRAFGALELGVRLTRMPFGAYAE